MVKLKQLAAFSIQLYPRFLECCIPWREKLVCFLCKQLVIIGGSKRYFYLERYFTISKLSSCQCRGGVYPCPKIPQSWGGSGPGLFLWNASPFVKGFVFRSRSTVKGILSSSPPQHTANTLGSLCILNYVIWQFKYCLT